MRLYTFSLFICFLACLSCSSPTTAGKEDYDCKHCGMPSQDYPQWQARVQFDTRKQWFCSPRCMFATYHQTKKKPQNIEVKDYYSLKFVKAEDAFFVIGSKILGPMGHDLVPFQDKKAAQDFSKEHAGKQIRAFPEVTNKIIQQLQQ